MPETLEELLARVSPALEVIFVRHRVPPGRAAEIVDDAIEILERKRKDIENPDQWLLEMVRRRLEEEGPR
jgi:hypothetical protein